MAACQVFRPQISGCASEIRPILYGQGCQRLSRPGPNSGDWALASTRLQAARAPATRIYHFDWNSAIMAAEPDRVTAGSRQPGGEDGQPRLLAARKDRELTIAVWLKRNRLLRDQAPRHRPGALRCFISWRPCRWGGRKTWWRPSFRVSTPAVRGLGGHPRTARPRGPGTSARAMRWSAWGWILNGLLPGGSRARYGACSKPGGRTYSIPTSITPTSMAAWGRWVGVARVVAAVHNSYTRVKLHRACGIFSWRGHGPGAGGNAQVWQDVRR